MRSSTTSEADPLINSSAEDYGSAESQQTAESQQPAEPEAPVPWYKVAFGIMLVVGAGCSFTAANVIQKIVCPSLNFWSLLLIRSMTQMAIMGTHLGVTKTHWLGPKEAKNKIFLQGLFGGLLLLAIFVAVKHVPLGNASAIFFCTPIATFALATCMLGERMGCYRALISVFMISGVILMTRPPFMFPSDKHPIVPSNGTADDNSTSMIVDPYSDDAIGLGYVAAICVPLLSAIVSIWTRQCRKVTASVLMFWFAAGSFMVAFGGICLGRVDNVFDLDYVEVLYTFLIVGLGMMGNMSYTFAVRWVSPSKANVFRSFEVILNYLLQIFLENMEFHSPDLAGIFLLLCAVFATGFEQEVMSRKIHPLL